MKKIYNGLIAIWLLWIISACSSSKIIYYEYRPTLEKPMHAILKLNNKTSEVSYYLAYIANLEGKNEAASYTSYILLSGSNGSTEESPYISCNIKNMQTGTYGIDSEDTDCLKKGENYIFHKISGNSVEDYIFNKTDFFNLTLCPFYMAHFYDMQSVIGNLVLKKTSFNKLRKEGPVSIISKE